MMPKPSTGDRHPRPHLAVRPLTRTSACVAGAEPEMGPAELAAGVATTDGQLAPLDRRSPTLTSSQAPIASRFGPGWRSRSASQWPSGPGCGAVAGADVPPDRRGPAG